MNLEDVFDKLKETSSMDTICVNVYQSVGYVAATDIESLLNVPEYPTSMRDGYAYKNNGANEYIKVGDIYAGKYEKVQKMNENECVYIATGAIVPDECDTVVMIEDTVNKNEIIKINSHPSEKWIRYPGSDVMKGSVVVKAGDVINEARMALLISVGINRLDVIKKPSIVVVSTGDEVKTYGKLNPGELYDVNRPMMIEMLRTLGYIVHDGGIIDDNSQEKLELLIKSENFDVIITSGGVSVGKKDFVRPMFEANGKVVIDKVSMKPGKPFVYVKSDTKHLFGLPGNPVSSYVSLIVFVNTVLEKMSGKKLSIENVKTAYLESDVKVDKHRFEYIRGNVKYEECIDKYWVTQTQDNQNSSCVKSLYDANCIIGLSPTKDNCYKAGQGVQIIQLPNTKIYNVKPELKIGVLTMSDRAYNNVYEDISGNEIIKYMAKKYSNAMIYYNILPDEEYLIVRELKRMSDELNCKIILTTGGTGPDIRDNTVKATKSVCDKILSGYGEVMRMKNFDKVKTTILSEQMAGIRYYYKGCGTLIVNLPGKPNSINECLDIIGDTFNKCVELIS